MKLDTTQCEFEMYKSMDWMPVKAVCGDYEPPKEILIGGELWVLKNQYCVNAHYERKKEEE